MSEEKGDWKKIFLEYGLGFVGDGVKHIYENIVERVNEFLDETEKKISEFLVKVVKSAILLTLFIIGLIFVLVGLSQYIGGLLSAYGTGLGYLVVGIGIFILVFIVKLLK